MTAFNRSTILKHAVELTTGDRDEQYGPPAANLSLAGEVKALLHESNRACPTARNLSSAEWEAIDMLVTKISRIVMAPVMSLDNYVDAAAFAALAGEMAGSRLGTEVVDEGDGKEETRPVGADVVDTRYHEALLARSRARVEAMRERKTRATEQRAMAQTPDKFAGDSREFARMIRGVEV